MFVTLWHGGSSQTMKNISNDFEGWPSNRCWIKTIFMDYFLSYFCTINKQYHIPFMRSYLKTDRWWFKVILITSDQTWKHQTNENNNIFLIIHLFNLFIQIIFLTLTGYKHYFWSHIKKIQKDIIKRLYQKNLTLWSTS